MRKVVGLGRRQGRCDVAEVESIVKDAVKEAVREAIKDAVANAVEERREAGNPGCVALVACGLAAAQDPQPSAGFSESCVANTKSCTIRRDPASRS